MLGELPKAMNCNTREAANASAVREAYLWFGLLSSDATHVTAQSLNWHLVREQEGDTVHLGGKDHRERRLAAVFACRPILRVLLSCCHAEGRTHSPIAEDRVGPCARRLFRLVELGGSSQTSTPLSVVQSDRRGNREVGQGGEMRV